MNPNFLLPFHASQGFLLKVNTYRITGGWEQHTLQRIWVAFLINGMQQPVKENKKLRKLSIRYFSCSKGGLMSNFCLVGFVFVWVQPDSSLPSCFLALMLAGQWKTGSTSTGKPQWFCNKVGCDFSHLIKLMLCLLTSTMSLLIRI